MQAPYIDPTTRDYILENGQIQNRNAVISRILCALNTPYGSYMFDPTFGNKNLIEKGASTVVNRKTREGYIKSALQFLVEDGTLSNLNVICYYYTFSTAKFQGFALLNDKQQYHFTWDLTL